MGGARVYPSVFWAAAGRLIRRPCDSSDPQGPELLAIEPAWLFGRNPHTEFKPESLFSRRSRRIQKIRYGALLCLLPLGLNGCGCGLIPCINPDRTFSKDHDFGLRKSSGTPIILSERYLIQYRNPVRSIVSNFHLHHFRPDY